MDNVLRRKEIKNKDRTATLFMIYASLTMVLYTLPRTKIMIPYIVLALIMLVSIVFLCYKNSRWMNYLLVLGITSVIVLSINLLTGVFNVVVAFNDMIRNIRFFLPVIWGCFALKNCNKNQRKIAIVVFAVMCVVIFYNTERALAINPLITRELAAGVSVYSADRVTYRMQNVGGFEFSYLMGIVTIGFVWMGINAKNKIVRIISLLMVLVCYYYVIQTMYTLLLILTVVGTVLVVFFHTKSVFLKCILILGVLAMVFFMEPFLKFLSDLFSFNFGLHEKFESMYFALKYEDASLMGSRPGMLKAAFINWTKNPIFGGKHIDSSSHSFVMLILESSGLIGISLYLGFFIKSWKMLRNELKTNAKGYSFLDSVMIYVLLLSFFNPIGFVFEIVLGAFFVVPIWISLANTDENDILYGRKRLRRKRKSFTDL